MKAPIMRTEVTHRSSLFLFTEKSMEWSELTPEHAHWRYAKIKVVNTSSVNVRTSPFVTANSYIDKIHSIAGWYSGRVNSAAMYTDADGLVWIPLFIAHEKFEAHPIVWVASKYVDIEFGELVNEPQFWDIDFTGTMPIYVTPAEKDEAVVYLRALTELSKSMPATAQTKVPIILEAYTDYLEHLRRT